MHRAPLNQDTVDAELDEGESGVLLLDHRPPRTLPSVLIDEGNHMHFRRHQRRHPVLHGRSVTGTVGLKA